MIEKIANYTKYKNDLLQKQFGNYAGLFLGQLIYWSNHKNKYGIMKNDRIWIYNTLEGWAKQLGCSSKTIQRTVKYLKEEGIIKTDFMAKNKRDRTIFYSVNYEKLSEKINFDDKDVQMNVQMVYIYNRQKINKSDKSKNLKRKNTTIQDMVQIWNELFPKNNVKLTKEISRYLVAAFKFKFKHSLEKWKEFLKLVKTSAYLMSEKFNLTLHWLLKFSTIDRLLQGDLGVKLKEMFLSKTKEEDAQIQQNEIAKTSELKKQINELDETEKCKETRSKILQKVGNTKYETWFKKVFLSEENNDIIVNIPTQNNFFLYDYITNHFRDILDNMNLFYRSTNVYLAK